MLNILSIHKNNYLYILYNLINTNGVVNPAIWAQVFVVLILDKAKCNVNVNQREITLVHEDHSSELFSVRR